MNARQKQLYYYYVAKPQYYRGYLIRGIDYKDFLRAIRRKHKEVNNHHPLAVRDNYGNIYTLTYDNYYNVVEAYPVYKQLLEQLKREHPHIIVMEDGSGTKKEYKKEYNLTIVRRD